MLDLYESNAFTHPGTLEVLGTPIDLSQVTNDTYIIAGITDHITPWQGCYATTQLLGGKVRFILSNSGHIQAILNPPGNPKSSYFVHEHYPADPEQWLARAQKRAGSWWEDWRDWLGQHSGTQKAAPAELGNEQYQPGVPAPGCYVYEEEDLWHQTVSGHRLRHVSLPSKGSACGSLSVRGTAPARRCCC